MQLRIIATGSLAGKTLTLRDTYRFENGVCTLVGSEEDVRAHAKCLEVNWCAYPEGDSRISFDDAKRANEVAILSARNALARAQAESDALLAKQQQEEREAFERDAEELEHQSQERQEQEARDGERDLQTDESEPNGKTDVPGDVQSNGAGSGPEGAGVGGVTVVTEAGTTGRVSDGNGLEAELNQKLLRAVQSLDHTNEEQWTRDGKPSLAAVASVYGSTGLTRNDVEAVAPGFRRQKPA